MSGGPRRISPSLGQQIPNINPELGCATGDLFAGLRVARRVVELGTWSAVCRHRFFQWDDALLVLTYTDFAMKWDVRLHSMLPSLDETRAGDARTLVLGRGGRMPRDPGGVSGGSFGGVGGWRSPLDTTT